MTATPRTDPASTDVDAGSWRVGVAVLVVGVVTAALVRGLVLETYHVPSAQPPTTVQPGDRVLVLKTDGVGGDDALVLVDDGTPRQRLVPAAAAGDAVVGTVVWRWWPLSRTGPVGAGSGS